MRVRTGIDTIGVESIRMAIEVHGRRYLTRVYTDAELSECQTAQGEPDAERLAGRWAVKEAVVKLLGLSGGSFWWRDIGCSSQPGGRPIVTLEGGAKAACEVAGVHDIDISLTHEAGTATAVAVAVVG